MAGKRFKGRDIAVVTILLLIAMSVTDGVRMVYAQVSSISGVCVGHTIERGNFDDDGEDEVKVDGTVYNNGDTITLDGNTYTVRIATPSSWATPYTGTDGNDFIVGTSGSDYIHGTDGNDFIVGLDGDDWLVGDVIHGTNGDDELQGGDDILCGNAGNDVLIGDYIWRRW